MLIDKSINSKPRGTCKRNGYFSHTILLNTLFHVMVIQQLQKRAPFTCILHLNAVHYSVVSSKFAEQQISSISLLGRSLNSNVYRIEKCDLRF